jgi:hypothetical protein
LHQDCYTFLSHLELGFFGNRDQSLKTLVLTIIDKTKYPMYDVPESRQFAFFPNRSMMLSYEKYAVLKDCIAMEVEKIQPSTSEWEIDDQLRNEAMSLLEIDSQSLSDLLKTWCSFLIPSDRLPPKDDSCDQDEDIYALRRYHPGWQIARTLEYIARHFQRIKQFKKASSLYSELLGQWRFCRMRRGKWWTRMIMHEKSDKEAMKMCQSALDDSFVRTGFRLGIQKRLKSFHSPKRGGAKGEWDACDVITIYGKTVKTRVPGRKCMFEGADDTGSNISMSVEEYALKVSFANDLIVF